MLYFHDNGRRVASKELRTFSETSQSYYLLKQPNVEYSKILENSIKFGGVSPEIGLDAFEVTCSELAKEIKNNPDYANLFGGVHIPFICKKILSDNDLGRDLEEIELPDVQKSFNARFPNSHFKAILQSNSKLPGSISIDPRSRYENFLESCKKGTVVGWYFPQALQEFDIESQRQQMIGLPNIGNICLSGGIDVSAALIGSPDLLISEEFYAPILCLSAYVHNDPRLILLYKSYGPHMEFWCMTQMLSRGVKQVSEQWSGGITIYQVLT